jgi:hypothetical protein
MKNTIYKAIEAAGLDPREFDLVDGPAEVRIKHKWSESYFVPGGDATHWVVHFVVGDGPEQSRDAYTWQTVISRLDSWLEEVKRDLETPDLWAQLQQDAVLFRAYAGDVTGNTPFTPDEQNEIASRLRELADEAGRAYSLSAAQMRVLDAKLDYLVSAASRIGRRDWCIIFAGVILTKVADAVVPSVALDDIFRGFFRAIGHFYGFPELPGP